MGVLLGVLVILLIIGAFVGLALTNLSAALALLAGVVVAVVVWNIIRIGSEFLGRRQWTVYAIVLAVIIAGAALIFGVGLPLMQSPTIGTDGPQADLGPTIAQITQYEINITPTTAQNVFSVEEVVFYDVVSNGQLLASGIRYVFPPRNVTSESRGFALQEVEIQPFGADPYTRLDLPNADGTGTVGVYPCSARGCIAADVEVIELPAKSFFAARETIEVATVPYTNRETMQWRTSRLERGVAFSYVPDLYIPARPVIQPLIGASTMSDWVAGVIGLLLAAAATPLIRPLIKEFTDAQMNKIRKVIRGDTRRKSSRSRR